MTISARGLTVAALLGAAFLVSACGESEKLGQATTYEKGKYKGKPDTRAYDNAPNVFSDGSNWTAGDKTSWESAMKTRQQRQNEYNRTN